MPSLKSTLVFLALLVIGYGVYTRLGRPGMEMAWNSANSTPSPATTDGFHGELDLPAPVSSPDPTNPTAFAPQAAQLPQSSQVPQASQNLSGVTPVPAPALATLSPTPTADLTGTAPIGTAATTIPETAPLPPGIAPTAANLPSSQFPNGAALATPSMGSLQTADPQNSQPITEISAAEQDVAFRQIMASVYERVQKHQSRQLPPEDAEVMLRELTKLWRESSLNTVQKDELSSVLDWLASNVIWSVDYYLKDQPPCRTDESPSITLQDIALSCGVSPRLLIRINGLEDLVEDIRAPLPSGLVLKTLRGPFRAEISPERHELTIYVDEMYAGRFPVGFGTNLAGVPIPSGTWPVREKFPASECLEDGPATGGVIRLDEEGLLALHGTRDTAAIQRDDSPAPGSILLSEGDILDLYDILTRDQVADRFTSTVTIVK